MHDLSLRHVNSLVAACGIWFPDQGLDLGPLHWEHGVLATGSPGKSLPWPLLETTLKDHPAPEHLQSQMRPHYNCFILPSPSAPSCFPRALSGSTPNLPLCKLPPRTVGTSGERSKLDVNLWEPQEKEKSVLGRKPGRQACKKPG